MSYGCDRCGTERFAPIEWVLQVREREQGKPLSLMTPQCLSTSTVPAGCREKEEGVSGGEGREEGEGGEDERRGRGLVAEAEASLAAAASLEGLPPRGGGAGEAAAVVVEDSLSPPPLLSFFFLDFASVPLSAPLPFASPSETTRLVGFFDFLVGEAEDSDPRKVEMEVS